MKVKFKSSISAIVLIIAIVYLQKLNFSNIFHFRPLLTVITGMVILTLSQFNKKDTFEILIQKAKWNVLLAGFLTTVMQTISSTGNDNSQISISEFSKNTLPLLYAIFLYIIFIITGQSTKADKNPESSSEEIQSKDWLNISPSAANIKEHADKIFIEFGLTTREQHVALKLLDPVSNREIAEQLYISETTVKNIFRIFIRSLKLLTEIRSGWPI